MPNQSLLSFAIRGGVAGGLATVGMTAAMLAMHRCLPARQRYGLPPEQIVDEILTTADLENRLAQRQFEALTMLVHHGYGTSMGAVYGIVESHCRPAPPIVSGMSFGFVVWTLSYLGWLPAMGMDASATREPLQRNALTIVSHLIWGGTTGLLTAASQASPRVGRSL